MKRLGRKIYETTCLISFFVLQHGGNSKRATPISKATWAVRTRPKMMCLDCQNHSYPRAGRWVWKEFRKELIWFGMTKQIPCE